MNKIFHSIHDWLYKKLPDRIPERKVNKTITKVIRAKELIDISFLARGVETDLDKWINYVKELAPTEDIIISDKFWFENEITIRIRLGSKPQLPLEVWVWIAPAIMTEARNLNLKIQDPEIKFTEAVVVNSFQRVGAVTGEIYESS